jgi:flagellar basal body-associated protein FliL
MAPRKKYSEMRKERLSSKEESSDEKASSEGSKKLMTKETMLITLVVVLLAALGGLGFLYMKEKNKEDSPTQEASEEAQQILEDVGKLILLPEDEEPTIATIKDIEALKAENAEFYKNAQNGDKILIYTQRAIIYDSDENRIINVAPIIRQPTPEAVEPDTESTTTDEETPLTIELRNGSTTGGVTNTYEEQINNNLGEDYSVTEKGNATMGGVYTGVVIYDLTGGAKSTLVQALADELGAIVETEFPSGERDGSADVVVIIGN